MFFDFNKGFNDNSTIEFNPKPIIAISAHIVDDTTSLSFAYSQAVIDAGGVPIVIPDNCNQSTIHSLMRGVDGVLLSGGDDIDGHYFNEENIPNLTDLNWIRDYYEFMLLRAALDSSLPIFGICRGCQLINVAFGGSIYQDLPSMYHPKPLQHSVLTNKHLPVHNIEIKTDSLLYKIVGESTLAVNSRHHQAIKSVAEPLTVTATAPDGVIEGVEAYETHKIIALQCHPENLATKGESVPIKKLFKFLVNESNLYRKAKEIHTLNPTVDSHVDTPMVYLRGGFDFAVRNSNSQVDWVKMVEGYLDCTITVAYIPQKTDSNIAPKLTFDTLERFKGDIDKLSDKIVVVDSLTQLLEAKAKGLKCVMLGVENGAAIADDINNIDTLKEHKIVYLTLCHNGTNNICDSAIGDNLYNGVSQFGKEVIERLNSLGITVDISHSSEKSTLDAVKLSKQPIIASHSSCKALYDHPRNLSNTAIQAIAAKGGVVQVCAYGGFLKSDNSATIHTVIDHIEHIINLTGYNHVGVGSDFDGGGGVLGFDGSNNFINISIELLRRGHSAQNIAKIVGGNILRVLNNNLQIS